MPSIAPSAFVQVSTWLRRADAEELQALAEVRGLVRPALMRDILLRALETQRQSAEKSGETEPR